MNRVTVLSATALAVVLILTACASDDTSVQSDFGENPVAVSFRWDTENGTYFTSTFQYLAGNVPGHDFRPGDYDDFIGDPLLLYINDAATGRDIILCNRPDCTHDARACNAYLPYDTYYDSRQTDLRKTSMVFVDGDYVYAHNAGSCIYRFNLDGTERTLAIAFDTKYYEFINGWSMNGKLYILAEALVSTGDFDISMAFVKALLEIDYLGGEYRELWIGSPDPSISNDISILAISGGKFYFLETIFPFNSRGSFSSDSEKIDFFNNTEYVVFSVDPGDDGQTQAETPTPIEVIHTGMGYEFMPCRRLRLDDSSNPDSDNLGIYFHSRRDASVYWLDLATGETEEALGNVNGTLQPTGVFGNRLFAVDFMRDFETGYRVSVDVTTGNLKSDDTGRMYDEMFIIDLATGEISQSAIITKRTVIDGGYSGNTDGFTEIIREEDGYFYIEVERLEREYDVWGNGSAINIYIDSVLIGKIPIADYFSGNSDAIEEIGWVSADEFLMMRGGA